VGGEQQLTLQSNGKRNAKQKEEWRNVSADCAIEVAWNTPGVVSAGEEVWGAAYGILNT
jgi:hypothetical protein